MMKSTRWMRLTLVVALMAWLMAGCASRQGTSPTSSDAPHEATTITDAQAQEGDHDLVILKEVDDAMKNTYTLIAVNPEAPFQGLDGQRVHDVSINTQGADALIAWCLSDQALAIAKSYGKETYGQALFYVDAQAPKVTGTIPKATEATKMIRLATTTSVFDSGLLNALLKPFETTYGYTVQVFSAGTGKAIAHAKMGNADLILVHAKSQEDAFVKAGYARTTLNLPSPRVSFLYNYFVLCGPKNDPAQVHEAHSVGEAFSSIAEHKALFVSRGDGSGTHTKELSLWPKALAITAKPESFAKYPWYLSANAGMGACLTLARDKGAYLLTDKATFLSVIKGGEGGHGH